MYQYLLGHGYWNYVVVLTLASNPGGLHFEF